MLKPSLCDYSDACILVKGSIIVVGQGVIEAAITANSNNRQVIFKNSALFTSYITKINNTQIDNAEDLDIVTPMYNLLEWGSNYGKTLASS